MYEFLKTFFADESGAEKALTFAELAEKLNASKEVKLANLADGGYVSVDKFNARETELKGIKEQLKSANDTIDSYKEMDIEGIKKSASEWKEKCEKDTEALKQQIADNARDYAKDLFFKDYKFSSRYAGAGIKADFDKQNFELKDGKFVGADEWMKGLQESEESKTAFILPAEPKPHFVDNNPDPNHPKPKKKTLSELMAWKNDHPDEKLPE